MALNPVGCAYNQYGIIHCAERTFGFGRKVNVTGSIKQCKSATGIVKFRLLGKNGYTALLFKRVCI